MAEIAHLILREGSIGDVNVFGLYIDVVQQIFVDRVVSALELIGRNRKKFVQTEQNDIAETQPLFVQVNHCPEQADR